MKSIGVHLTELEAALQYIFFLEWHRKADACPLRRYTIDLLPDAIFSFMQHEMERLISQFVCLGCFFFHTGVYVRAAGTW